MKFSFVFIYCLIFTTLQAQFVINGDASEISEGCFELTPNELTQSGSVWYEVLINLNSDLNISFTANFGCDDAGADGLYFVLQPVSTGLGSSGGGIGYDGILPSLGIEFDTWQNGEYSDPSDDHISIMQDGFLDHGAATNLAGPESILEDGSNAEDCNEHLVNITWNTLSQTVSVYVDCNLRVTYIGDIITSIFDGNPEVFLGFTSATGGASNQHLVCFNYFSEIDSLTPVTICPGDSVLLEVPEGFNSYAWLPAEFISNTSISNPTVFPIESTIYTVIMTDECGYSIYDTVTVNVANPDLVNLVEDITLCNGQSYTFNAEYAGATYLWSNASILPTLTINESGTYWVSLDFGNCFDSDTVTVNYLPAPEVDLGNDTTLCGFNQFIVFDVTSAGSSYLWQDGSNLPTYTISEDGLYSVELTIGGCKATDSIAVNYASYPEINIGGDTAICIGTSYTLNAGSPLFDYLWQDGSVNNTFVVNSAGSIQVQVTVNGCATTSNIEVTIDPCICSLILPNAFTPNGDGINDVFKQLDCESFSNYTMQIFNRWGQLVFQTSNLNEGWNGIFNGKPADLGSYVYVIQFAIADGESGVKKGNFLLMK